MKAIIQFKDGDTLETTAKKLNGSWMIGGDYALSVFELGATILIYSKGKIYKLKGNRLIFQDYE